MEQATELDEVQEVIEPGQEQETAEEQKPTHEEIQEQNWKSARSRMEEQTRQINEQHRLMSQMANELENLRKMQTTKVQEPDEDEEYLTDSEKKLNRKIRSLEQKLDQQVITKRQMSIQEADEALREKLSDYDEVMSPQNLEFLKKNNRALFKAISSLEKDPYEQGLAAYDALKSTSWFQSRASMADKEKLEQNIKKPMSVQAVRKQSPLSEANKFANGLTPELKKVLLAEMNDARKRA